MMNFISSTFNSTSNFFFSLQRSLMALSNPSTVLAISWINCPFSYSRVISRISFISFSTSVGIDALALRSLPAFFEVLGIVTSSWPVAPAASSSSFLPEKKLLFLDAFSRRAFSSTYFFKSSSETSKIDSGYSRERSMVGSNSSSTTPNSVLISRILVLLALNWSTIFCLRALRPNKRLLNSFFRFRMDSSNNIICFRFFPAFIRWFSGTTYSSEAFNL
mmetsp:Transcript_38679/g.43969  ORF Transcript_38679/g.43969 Transcript_38679/m.43969 type:complete len:219 (+) Transcript_38679:1033-1689(+)